MSTKNHSILFLSVGLGACASNSHTTDLAAPANVTHYRSDHPAVAASELSGTTSADPAPASKGITNPYLPSTMSSQARAQKAMPWEFTVGGAGVSNDNVDAGAGQLAGSVGYYLNDVVEVSVRQNGWFSDGGQGSPDIWNGATRGAIDLHFPFDRFVPYVGANLGYAYGDTIPDTWLGGPEAGAKFYLKDDAFLQVGVEYQFFFDGDDTVNSAFDDGQLLYGISLGLRF